jgi:CheY-like chemotaxis protein
MSTNSPPGRSAAVLVVEDDNLIRFDITESLRDAGFAVIEASNGDEALTVLTRDDAVALVVSDVQMPGKIDGLALAAWLRREMPSIATVLVSGRLPAAAISPMADATFEKPIDTTVLVKKVGQLLSERQNWTAPCRE